ncbi:hypothetical protein [Dyadobacter sp. LHD-138]|uniref:toxin-antitoxin system YwqK family antitoxin n=1 Tax=Dyadobacter sp. LHD-138 TaxID=3071413 RepID=UPI0027E05478|nr:hypothetical protein [Dyadobacter sp. LHD-138]MDQ6482180.1 hypothetical protein [Dyadobacter sp. LHD-138]
MSNRKQSLYFLFLFLFSCSTDKKSEFRYFPDGSIELETKYVNDSTGVFLAYYPGGARKDSMTLVNGKLHGRLKRYFPNGKLKEDCYWVNDKKVGPCNTYFLSGNLESVATFDDSVKVGNAYEYYDIPGKKLRFTGNYAKVNGRKWVNYTTLYDSLGTIEKASVQIRDIKGSKTVSINDSLKLTFDLDHLELPLIRVFIGDYDQNYNQPENAKDKVYDGKDKRIVAYIVPAKLGKHTARGFVQNYKVVENFKDGTYKTYGKDIYWSYDYEVVNK